MAVKTPETIPVETIRWATPQDGPGMNGAGTVNHKKCRLSYWPGLRQFRVEFNGAAAFVPVERAMFWIPE